jgi:hypothetical protein
VLATFVESFSGGALPASASVAPDRRKSASCRFSWFEPLGGHLPKIIAKCEQRGRCPSGSAGSRAT